MIDNLRFIRHMDDFNEELGVGKLDATFEIENEEEEISIGNEIPKKIKRP